jgi:hypothetical protein
MKTILGLLLIGVKIYCGFKVILWLYHQNFDKTNHPISEIQPILVFLLFDLWMMISANQIEKIQEN